MSAPAPPAAAWEIKAARLLIRLLEDRKAPVDERLRILASDRLPHNETAKNRTVTRSMAESSLAGYRMILRDHPDLTEEERRTIEESMRRTEDLIGLLRQEERRA
jgi:hypothetical protein